MTASPSPPTATPTTGTGAAVLGHPAAPIAWLARALHQYDAGAAIAAGAIVIPGAVSRALPVAARRTARATFAGLGRWGDVRGRLIGLAASRRDRVNPDPSARPSARSSALVDVPRDARACDDHDEQDVVLDRVDDAVVTDADAEAGAAAQRA